jgi:undecaprenyl diphosphate synthase
MLRAAAACAGNRLTREAFAAALPAPDVDLLIRTAGEQRLSDFLLWECAYAEFVFCSRMWPDFDASDLGQAVGAFQSRQRRFGALPPAA